MTNRPRRIAAAISLLLGIANAAALRADDWTGAVEVTYDQKRCIAFRARLSGDFLAVEAAIERGWHTFAMDNPKRAAEKLGGRKALSMDQPTEISVDQGLEVRGSWFQSIPKDFSRPELRWFSWGFEERVLFVTEVRRSGPGPARIRIRGQVCNDTTCRKIDVALAVPILSAGIKPAGSEIDPIGLIQVR